MVHAPNVDLDKGGRIPQLVRTYLGPSKGWKETDAPTSIEYVIDGGSQPVEPGQKGYLIIPEWVWINDWVLMAERSCSAVMDLWRVPQANFPPTVANTITGSAKPTLSNQQYARSTVLTGWDRNIDQGDVLAFIIDSANANCFRLTLVLECVRLKGTG